MESVVRVQILDNTSFHLMRMPRGKAWIHLFFSRWWIEQTWIFNFDLPTRIGEEKHCIQTRFTLVKKFILFRILSVEEGLGKYICPVFCLANIETDKN